MLKTLSVTEAAQVNNLLATWDTAPTFPDKMLHDDPDLACALYQADAYDALMGNPEGPHGCDPYARY